MFGRSSLLAVATLAAIAGSLPAQSRKLDPRAIEVDSIVRTQVDSGFSGVVLIALGDTVLLHRAYDARGVVRAELDTTSSFWIGSMTKGFTAHPRAGITTATIIISFLLQSLNWLRGRDGKIM